MDIKQIISTLVKTFPALRPFLRREAKLAGEISFDREAEAEEAFYAALYILVSELYGGKISKDEFIRRFGDTIENSIGDAWNAGMLQDGLDPEQDMLLTYVAIQMQFAERQKQYIPRLADDILRAAAAGVLLASFIPRLRLWSSRYREMATIARVVSAPMDLRFTWRLGATEEHCRNCFTLNGQVGTSAQWEELFALGIYPKSGELECGGWNCDCDIIQTDEPITEGGLRWQ